MLGFKPPDAPAVQPPALDRQYHDLILLVFWLEAQWALEERIDRLCAQV
jgi:hypothetical protein